MDVKKLSQEQELFIEKALEGHDILVDACIGSGKTTAIQELCNRMGFFKRVLYLTYNKLLKLDAKSRIKMPNVTVTNYHGYAYQYVGPGVGVSRLLQEFNRRKPDVPRVDVLILDEYQDLETEMSEMLLHIRRQNPGMQVVAVGDMQQKIYDKTRLNVMQFMHSFLKEGFLSMEFTQCFRLGHEHAAMLGNVWKKQIVGVNPEMDVRTMDFKEAVEYLGSITDPGKVLVLGPNTGYRVALQNKLESDYSDVYNKHTLWSSIMEGDSSGYTEPGPDSAVFCTYDKSKGMERDICVVCGWTAAYWASRLNKPNVSYEILRNVFLVAASRGKKEIIFLEEPSPALEMDMLSAERGLQKLKGDVPISGMFSFKYQDDINAAISCLEMKTLEPAGDTLKFRMSDGLVDLSPCIGVYMECDYFRGCDIDVYIQDWFAMNPDDAYLRKDMSRMEFDRKVLYYASLQLGQRRYENQVSLPLLTEHQKGLLHKRLGSKLIRGSECQVSCSLLFGPAQDPQFKAKGFADVVEGDTVWELKFTAGLQPEHYLQLACYMCALGKPHGKLWNVHTGELVEVHVPDRQMFLDLVANAVTKGQLKESGDCCPGDGACDIRALVFGKHGCGKKALCKALLGIAEEECVSLDLECMDTLPDKLCGRVPVYVECEDSVRMGNLTAAASRGEMAFDDVCRLFLADADAFPDEALWALDVCNRFVGNGDGVAGDVWEYLCKQSHLDG